MGFSNRATAAFVLGLTLVSQMAAECCPKLGGTTLNAYGAHPQGPAYLGIDFRDINSGEVGTLHLKSQRGAEIVMVDHDGPAGKAGLREHDVVLQFNGAAVDNEEQLRKLLRDMQPGKTVSLYICRGGNEQTVTAVMANRAQVEKRAWEQHWTVPSPQSSSTDDATFVAPQETASVPVKKGGFGSSFMPGHLLALSAPYTGASVDQMGPQLAQFFGVHDGKGLLVHEVEGNSPAAVAGLRAGDVVVKINGGNVATEKDWTRALHDSKGHPVSLTIVRDKQEQMLTMVPDAKKRSAVETPPPPGAVPLMMMFR